MTKKFLSSPIFHILLSILIYLFFVFIFDRYLDTESNPFLKKEVNWTGLNVLDKDVIPGIFALINAIVKGIVDSHIIIIFMFFYIFSFLSKSHVYRKLALERKLDLSYFYKESIRESKTDERILIEEENIFDKTEYDKIIETVSKSKKNKDKRFEERYSDLYNKLNDTLDKSKDEARKRVETKIESTQKTKENGIETFSHYQNMIALFGFLGTVLGLILAIGLTENIFGKEVSADATTEWMPKIVKGLSVAFVTTAFSLIFTKIILLSKRKFEFAHDEYIRIYHLQASTKIDKEPIPDHQNIQYKLRKVSGTLKNITDQLTFLGKKLGGVFECAISDPLDEVTETISTLNSEINSLNDSE
ncbi:MotA/TolQ/ExbB proton channel family protein [uncultured Psychroserpens sp.]|uniref:MotA/TolQ/ExbB proton channel family protein n=1 Tax=uncultured Psychroserpens sp. TaxID=255436 RepID=UPI002609C63C|nr:MotA/TolQ/ExbB proton channel family protein [uncultured Psychroserpens sp.]